MDDLAAESAHPTHKKHSERMKLIEHIKDPARVLVIWQRPDANVKGGTGDRYVVGEVRRDDGRVYLQYYDNADTAQARELGFAGFTSFPVSNGMMYNGSVETVLAKRLAPTSRSDYADYLLSHRIDPAHADKLSVLGLLAYTGGKLAGDGFSFAHTFDDAAPPFDFTCEIAGFRHHAGMQHFAPLTLLDGKEVQFVPDPTNIKDKDAIAIMCEDVLLGHVPKGLRTVMRGLMEAHSVTGHITRLNGTPDRPCVMVLVQVR